MISYDTIIIGGGASGLMCGKILSENNKKILILEKSEKIAKKILISGGGRCNFTNLYTSFQNFNSTNPHFCKSALSRYQPQDFINLLDSNNIDWNEKKLGQLFCNDKSQQIVDLLTKNYQNVEIKTNYEVLSIDFKDEYIINNNFKTKFLVIATGGPSIPKMGATNFALKVAQKFNIKTKKFIPALVPLMFNSNIMDNYFKDLSGVSFLAKVSCNNINFTENILITHRGLSGPAILQISLYWNAGDSIYIDFLPDFDFIFNLQNTKNNTVRKLLRTKLAKKLADRLVDTLFSEFADTNIQELSLNSQEKIVNTIHNWKLVPSNSEGFRTAEVSSGGISTSELSSKTMEVKKQKGLYFIGEAVDVTGWLGGYNFAWCWSSGFVCAESICNNS